MAGELFDKADEDDRRRLLQAGWTSWDSWGGVRWLSPSKQSLLSQEEALKWLGRDHDNHCSDCGNVMDRCACVEHGQAGGEGI